MTQATDLGSVANQQGSFYRARLNLNIQALVTHHYGATEPPVLYANMIWFSSGDGYIKIRSPTNSSWQNIGTIGPPLRWTNIDLPAEGFTTGDIKGSYNPTQQGGWLLLNDGTIGGPLSGALSRSNEDCWPLFNLLWNISGDDWCSVYLTGSLSRSGRGASALADWNARRHIGLPKMYGRVPAAAGAGAGLGNYGVATWHGVEYVQLGLEHLWPHSHTFSAVAPPHNHALAQQLPSYVAASGHLAGQYTVADTESGYHWTENGGEVTISGTTSTSGSGTSHFNIQPTTYVNYFIKL